MAGWTYFVIVEPPEYPPEHPKGLVRQRPGAPDLEAEELQLTDGTWHPSEVIALAFLGHDEQVEPVGEERALALAWEWRRRGELRHLPEGLGEGTDRGPLWRRHAPAPPASPGMRAVR